MAIDRRTKINRVKYRSREFLLPGPDNQAARRFLILSYFYGFLILRSDRVAGTYSLARPQVADSRRAYGFVYMCMHVYVRVCACICTCVCMYMYVCACEYTCIG